MKIFYDEKGKYGKYFEIQGVEDFPKMKKIKGIFVNIRASTQEEINFSYSLENVIDGSYAFYWSQNFNSFDTNLSKLENGTEMFHVCSNLTSFNGDLSSLTNGYQMFDFCTNLTTFSADLPSLIDGERMFYCTNLTSFSIALPNLTNGYSMFEDCKNLESFNGDLSSLIDGDGMFEGCKNLESFSSKLSSLKSGHCMFYECNLNENSVRNIVNNINNLAENGYKVENDDDWTYEVLGEIKTISSSYRGRIDIHTDSSVTKEIKIECANELIKKGWTTVYFDYVQYQYTNVSTE